MSWVEVGVESVSEDAKAGQRGQCSHAATIEADCLDRWRNMITDLPGVIGKTSAPLEGAGAARSQLRRHSLLQLTSRSVEASTIASASGKGFRLKLKNLV